MLHQIEVAARLKSGSGMLTAYVQRSTEDHHEKMTAVRTEVDFFLDGTTDTKECGFGELASVLGV